MKCTNICFGLFPDRQNISLYLLVQVLNLKINITSNSITVYLNLAVSDFSKMGELASSVSSTIFSPLLPAVMYLKISRCNFLKILFHVQEHCLRYLNK